MSSEMMGLVKHEPESCWYSYTLFAPDHGQSAYLIDMEGKVVHEWRLPGVHFAELLSNGNLLYDTRFAREYPRGIQECDWEGREAWFYECRIHHDAQRLENGNTIMLNHENIYNPAVYRGVCTKNTVALEVTPEKEIVWLWHSDRHIQELEDLLGIDFPREEMDWTHTNTVQVLPENESGRRDNRFREGNVLISHRNLDTIAVIDRESHRIVWAWGPGELDYQHTANMLPNGHVLLFDNGPLRDHSRVLEVDPLSGGIVWEFKDDPPQEMHAKYLSGQQRLPNGNTFICAGGTEDGRLLEVTPEGEVVWDYRNPLADRAKGRRMIYRAYRYPAEQIEPML